MLQFVAPSQINDEAAEIERFRARHRRLLRTQQQQFSPASLKVEDLDEDDGRKRKISANWHLKQQQARASKLQDDSHWRQSAGAEMLAGLNAFDFSTSPEAFYEDPCAAVQNDTQRQQHMAHVAKQVTSMGFHCASMWELTAAPTAHYTTCDDQLQALYHQPQYYA